MDRETAQAMLGFGIFLAIVATVAAIWFLSKGLDFLKEQAERKRQKQEAEEQRREEQVRQEQERRAEEARRKQEWYDWYLCELNRAKMLSRSDQEIEAWAKRHAQEILAREAEILEQARKTILNQGVRECLDRQAEGDLVKRWLEEPLKELKIAKGYIAEGGAQLQKLEQVLSEEWLKAKVVEFRHELVRKLEQERTNSQPVTATNRNLSEELQELKGAVNELKGFLGRSKQGVPESDQEPPKPGLLRRAFRGLAQRFLRHGT